MRNALPARQFVAFGLLIALVTCVLTAVGCNTVHGLGQDIEKGGQKLQDASGTQAQEW